ncbi:MAG TPA: ATP-binding protein [Verrucomicrobiae bacterium]|nr:ATP-binding protein [Verrucomicrobiae bacterium]
MADHKYPIEVQPDFLQKITGAQPVHALAEFIWNSVDADATIVSVGLQENQMGALSKIIVTDNGTGIKYDDAPELFKSLGGSWKRSRASTAEGRFLHGRDGRGRFKAFALGSVAVWDVAYNKGPGLYRFTVTMMQSNLREILISDEVLAPAGRLRGVTLTISELHQNYRSLTTDAGRQEFVEIFAIYLTSYPAVTVSIGGVRVDPAPSIASRKQEVLQPIESDGKAYDASLEIIEWRSATERSLYLCNEKGFPLKEVEERRFHIGSFQFSAYLRSEYFSKLQNDSILELAQMRKEVVAAIDEAQSTIKDYFRGRAASEARDLVEAWKAEEVYPYEGEAITQVEQVERQVFDIVAVKVAEHLPDFTESRKPSKALHLRLLRQAIERSPEDLQIILQEVLKLPVRQQEDLAGLLRDVSLSAIISSAKVVADRLKFLDGLDAILFDADKKQRLKERSQLHRIIAENCWLFGEEYSLSVDDQSLTEVLRKHRKLLGDDAVVDEPVRTVAGERGIVDLVLSRAIRRYKSDDLAHLVVELKAPKVKVAEAEVLQIEKYAMAVVADERFRSLKTTWAFWVVSDDFGDYAVHRMKSVGGGNTGRIHEEPNSTIWIKSWAQVLEDNRARMQFFKERLEYKADKGKSLEFLKQRYDNFLRGVVVEEEPTAAAAGQLAPTTEPSHETGQK